MNYIGRNGKELIVLRKTPNESVTGRKNATYSEHTRITGIIRGLSGTEIQTAKYNGINSTHLLYADGELDIKHGDKIKNGSLEYDVKFVNDVMNMGRRLQVDLELVAVKNGL